jgi:hypothetical protein
MKSYVPFILVDSISADEELRPLHSGPAFIIDSDPSLKQNPDRLIAGQTYPSPRPPPRLRAFSDLLARMTG